MRKLLCWLAHDWSQWSAPRRETNGHTYHAGEYNARYYIRTASVQGRSCYRCGRVDERTIRKMGEHPHRIAPYVEADA